MKYTHSRAAGPLRKIVDHRINGMRVIDVLVCGHELQAHATSGLNMRRCVECANNQAREVERTMT
jgi:hypothetical protein